MQHKHTKVVARILLSCLFSIAQLLVCARLTLYSSSSPFLFFSEKKGIERGRTVRSCVALIANTADKRYAPGWRVRVRGAVAARGLGDLAGLCRVLALRAQRARGGSADVLVRSSSTRHTCKAVRACVAGVTGTIGHQTAPLPRMRVRRAIQT